MYVYILLGVILTQNCVQPVDAALNNFFFQEFVL